MNQPLANVSPHCSAAELVRAVERSERQSAEDSLRAYADCIFDSGDLIEVRLLPSGRRLYCTAANLAGQVNALRLSNETGQNVYVGANPRSRQGGKANDVKLARCLFADWDGIDLAEVHRRIEAAGLPEPTLIIGSGHGFHGYWRLAEPLTDLAAWSALQKSLITAVDSDKSIHDPPRIMRPPGFNNVKREPHVQCAVVSADPQRRYAIEELRAILDRHAPPASKPAVSNDKLQTGPRPAASAGMIDRARRYVATLPPAISGSGGHDATFRVAYALRVKFGLSEANAWPLLCEYNARCKPPWAEAELRHKLASPHGAGAEPGFLLNAPPPNGQPRHAERNGHALNARHDELPRPVDPATPWPEIEPLDTVDLPPFPEEVLPPVLRRWVEEASVATQTPPALPALLSLACIASTVARRVDVEPQPGWREPCNLFVCAVLDPASRKSAVFADATAPLRALEQELIEEARPLVAVAASERRRKELALRRFEKVAAEGGKNSADASHQADSLAEELAATPELALPRLLVDDATEEKIGAMLAQQAGRIFSASGEGGPFGLMAGKYAKGGQSAFDVYLKAHAGDDLRTDRIGRESVLVERPALTAAFCVQPSVIRGLADRPEFRGRGLLARFVYALPASWIGHRAINPPPVKDATRDEYAKLIRRLAPHDWPPESAKTTTLRLVQDAKLLFDDWQHEIEVDLADGGRLEVIRDWGGKLAGLTLRLAAVLHCAQHGLAGDISAETIGAAVAIARWAIPHAEATLGLMDARGAGDADARYLLRWIVRRGEPRFTRREAHAHGRKRWPTAEDVFPPLTELSRRGYVRRELIEPSADGGRPSEVWTVNPEALNSQSLETVRKTQQNPPDDGSHGGFAGFCVPNEGRTDSPCPSPTKNNCERVQVTI